MTATIKITRKVLISEVDDMLDWLKSNPAHYEFTGEGIELITFQNSEDAVAFKLRFSV